MTKAIAAFVGWTYKNGVDVKKIIKKQMIVDWPLPPNLDEEASKSADKVALFKREIDQFCHRIQKRNENIEKAYFLIYG